MTVDALLPGVEASKAQIESLTLGDSLHRITSLLFIFGNFALRQKKINQIWFFITEKVFYAGRSRQCMTALMVSVELSVVEEEH
ncbi:hypothetical protein [Salmonella enterica]|uniref:hypothetical protein n=1 Tax=Salmonella enterica TaxID=28901 RepID=UPI0012FD3FDF|nr:hypothetical protein [Salmonella enterica]EEP4792555.1 hypothetical protein [Salmonella enterica subsp. enterica]EHH5639489.1 hypothetical protein [Salmonella enterica]EIR7435245.1 hypothetical protein [Salmonella enterica subsp. enterica serovar Newport]